MSKHLAFQQWLLIREASHRRAANRTNETTNTTATTTTTTTNTNTNFNNPTETGANSLPPAHSLAPLAICG